MSVGKRIKELRIVREITINELAERADVSLGMLSMVENEKRNPSKKMLEKLAPILKTTVEYLDRGDTKTIIDSFIDSLVENGLITGRSVELDDDLRSQILEIVEADIKKREKALKEQL